MRFISLNWMAENPYYLEDPTGGSAFTECSFIDDKGAFLFVLLTVRGKSFHVRVAPFSMILQASFTNGLFSDIWVDQEKVRAQFDSVTMTEYSFEYGSPGVDLLTSPYLEAIKAVFSLLACDVTPFMDKAAELKNLNDTYTHSPVEELLKPGFFERHVGLPYEEEKQEPEEERSSYEFEYHVAPLGGRGEEGESTVWVELTENEYSRVMAAAAEVGGDFMDCAEVADVYKKVYSAMKNDIEENFEDNYEILRGEEGGEFLPLFFKPEDHFEFWADFPSLDDLDIYEIEHHIKAVLASDPEDLTRIDAYVDNCEGAYYSDLKEFAFRTAVRQNALHYVEAHADDVELNDEDYLSNWRSSSYFDDSKTEEMNRLLAECGAVHDETYHAHDYFAMETNQGRILSFTIQQEVFFQYMDYIGLTPKDVFRICEEKDYNQAEDESTPKHIDRNIVEDLNRLGLYVWKGRIHFHDVTGEDGWSVKDLLEDIGYDLEFEGESERYEVNGVYYIE